MLKRINLIKPMANRSRPKRKDLLLLCKILAIMYFSCVLLNVGFVFAMMFKLAVKLEMCGFFLSVVIIDVLVFIINCFENRKGYRV